MGSEPQSKLVSKIVGGLFAAVIAPIVVGVGVNYSQKFLDTSKPEPEKEKPAEKSVAAPTTKESSSTKPQEAPPLKVEAPQPALALGKRAARKGALKKAPPTPIRLFNRRDLSGFYTFLGPTAPGEPVLGKNNDPDKVFTVRNGEIHITGKTLGALITEKEYDNYHLSVEYKWGQRTWPPREGKPKLSAILLHAFGPDGAMRGHWPQAYRCNMSLGTTGDIFLAAHPVSKLSLAVEADAKEIGQTKARVIRYVYKPGAPITTLTNGNVFRLGSSRVDAEGPATAGAKDWEKPEGESNTLACICSGPTITVILNGTTVNHVTDLSHIRGKIAFLSEGATLVLQSITLTPIAKE